MIGFRQCRDRVICCFPGSRRSRLLSMRHTRKSFIINEGGPEVHPTGSLMVLMTASVTLCAAER